MKAHCKSKKQEHLHWALYGHSVQSKGRVGTRCTLVQCSLYTRCIYRGLPRIS
jgi:hypothetical protein